MCRKKGVLSVAEVGSIDRPVLFEDRRMWRLLLAQLHPDVGGDHELFTFACAVKERVCSGEPVARDPARPPARGAEHFLRAWQDAMNRWASHNRNVLKNS